jgi:putative nucleotidyltransferase with HDIG domain
VTEAVLRAGRSDGAQPSLRRLLAPLPMTAWAYWTLVVATGATILAFSCGALTATRHQWEAFALLSGAASIAQLCSVRLMRNRVFHPAIVFVVAGALLLAPAQLVLMCLIQHIADWLKQRYAWYIQPFNIGNYVLSASAAALTVARIGGAEQLGRQAALAGSLAAVSFVAVNRVLLVGMLRYGRGMTVAETGLMRVDDASLELVLALMGVPLALLSTLGVGTASLALVPLLLISIAQRALHRLESASETIRAQNERLEATTDLVMQRSTAALEALSATVDARDAYTAGHSRRVREIALVLGAELQLDGQELESLAQAALLHDIGKIGVPDAVLLKDGKLDQTEWMLMRAHAEEGARIIERLGYLEEVVPAIRHHHERIDGRGYPYGLWGREIPLAARIIHVSDALDAMLTKRVYRSAMTLVQAAEEIRNGAGSDFCVDCVRAFESALTSHRLDDVLPREGA